MQGEIPLYNREFIMDPRLQALERYWEITDATIVAEKSQYIRRLQKERLTGGNTLALVVGRFQPPHAGHFYLIESALAVAEQVVIGIGSANKRDEDNPFTALRREHIFRKVLSRKGVEDRVKFAYLNDYPDDDLWCSKAMEQAEQFGRVDVIIGNNGWVNNIFREKGYRALEIPELQRADFQGAVVRRQLREEGVLKRL